MEIKQEDFWIGDQRCFNCNEQATAVWHGMGVDNNIVAVCAICATDILPALIADAVWLDSKERRKWNLNFINALEKSSVSFWRAATARSSHH